MQKTLHILPILAGVILANFLFWNEQFGVNCLIFAVFWILTLAYVFPEAQKSKGFLATALGSLLCAAMVAWHNSGASKFTYLLSIASVAGFAQMSVLKSIGHAFLVYISNWFKVPKTLLKNLSGETKTNQNAKTKPTKWLTMSFLPFLVVLIFYAVYYLANPKFATLSDSFWGNIGRIFSFDISLSHVFFILFLSLFVGAGLLKFKNYLGEHLLHNSDFLTRDKSSTKTHFDTLGLKKEFQQGLITLGLLNVLLFFVNITDLLFVWSPLDQETSINLQSYVHEGTSLLIFSIVMAMAVLFYFFRKNLNFYPKNRILQILSLVWLIQNGVLALSVGIRNWHYVDYHGLAYKRIGVFLFLILALVGLLTLGLKIRDKRSNSWLWRVNGWAFYVVLLLNSLMPWDQYITRYNLETPLKGLSQVRYLLYEVSDKNICILEENVARIKALEAYPEISETEIEDWIKEKRIGHDSYRSGSTWKSWNWADATCKTKPQKE